MAIIIVSQGSIGGGGAGNGHNHDNLALLNMLKIDDNGNLTLNGVPVGEKATETTLQKILTQKDITNGYFDLPANCDTDRAITLILCGMPQIINDDWKAVVKDNSENSQVAWKGLNMEQLVQAGDKVSMTYYRKF